MLASHVQVISRPSLSNTLAFAWGFITADVFELKEQVLGTVPVKVVVTVAAKFAQLTTNKPIAKAIFKKLCIFIIFVLIKNQFLFLARTKNANSIG